LHLTFLFTLYLISQ